MRLETKIISTLLHHEEFARKAAPFILPEYFESKLERCIVEEFQKFFTEFNKLPDLDIIKIELGNRTDLTDREYSDSNDIVNKLAVTSEGLPELEWILQKAEKFCKDQALANAVIDAIRIIEGEDPARGRSALPGLLQDALAISFDSHIGHDYFEDFELRYEDYHTVENKVPFKLDRFNFITDGGLSNKTLNVILAGVHVGKSLFMCDYAASAVSMGYNVLYISMEMSEIEIAKRIDANRMNITIKDVKGLEHELFKSKIGRIKEKTAGKLIIKEYPTATAHAGHFMALIDELKQKKGFVPQVVIVDYINICASSRLKLGNAVNSYALVKAISEELRGLAQKYDVPVLSATQVNREGFDASDLSMTNTSESWGLPQTADFMFALTSSEELESLNQIMVKQLKNRYMDLGVMKRFVVGICKPKMQLFEPEESAQEGLVDAGVSVIDAAVGRFGDFNFD